MHSGGRPGRLFYTRMTQIPDWLQKLMDTTRPAMVAFNGDCPDAFLYDNRTDDWFDWPDLFGIPVFNTRAGWIVADDEECPLLPLWKGELTGQREMRIREFQLRFANTGDF